MTPSNLSSILARLTSTCGFGVVSATQMQNDAGLTALEIEALDAADLIREIPSRRHFVGNSNVMRSYRVFF